MYKLILRSPCAFSLQMASGPVHARQMVVGMRSLHSDLDKLDVVTDIGTYEVRRSAFWRDVESVLSVQPETDPWRDGVWVSMHTAQPEQLIIHFGRDEFVDAEQFMVSHSPEEGLKRVVLDPHIDSRRVQYTGHARPLYVTYVGFENTKGEDSFVSAAIPWVISNTVYSCSLVTVYAHISTRVHRLCSSCGLPAFLKCVRCRSVYYCNSDCQRSHWRTHRSKCRVVE